MAWKIVFITKEKNEERGFSFVPDPEA